MKLGEVRPRVGRERVDLEDVLGMVKLPKGKWVTLRILPNDIMPVRRHWVNIIAGKDKREVRIPKLCVSFDPSTEGDKKGVHCPYCDLAESPEQFYLANVIVRDEQDNQPRKIRIGKGERESGFKDMGSDSWTPVQVLRITSSLAKKLQGLKDLNKAKIKGQTKTFDISDAKYGCDISVKYDGDAKGPDKYQVQKGERAPLTEEEQEYLIWELHEGLLDEIGRESEKEATKEVNRMQIVGQEDIEGDDDDDDDMNLGKKKGAKSSSKKPARRSSRDDDDDDDDDDVEDGDGEDDDPPPRGKKSSSKSSKKPARRSRDEEEEDDDDDDDDDVEDGDGEDDDPPPRGKKSSSSKKPARRSRDDDDDDDGDDEDGDDDDDDEDGEDDDPPPRGKKSSSKSSKKPLSKKPARRSRDDDEDDDDDDDDDDDEDDDEDDDPPPRGKKSSSKSSSGKKPASKSSKRRSNDDDDDDIPF